FSLSPDASMIVFDTIGEPHEDLWISNLNGSGRRRLLTGGLNRSPVWSPNGEEIAFFSNRGGFYDQWLIHPDGSGLQQLTAVTAAGRQMQSSVWVEGGGRLLANRQAGGPSFLNPHPAAPTADPPNLPGFDRPGSLFYLFSPPSNGALIGHIEEATNVLGRYSIADGKLERLATEGSRPLWIPDSGRYFIFKRGEGCFLYDLTTRREKLLFSVAPNSIYHLGFDAGGTRIFFTLAIHDADLWMGQMG